MPTYQYACTTPECGNRFELVQSFTDPTASECPVCAGPVRKVFSAVGVVFKGSGFYRTDSRAKAGASESSNGTSASPKSDSGSSSTDSKSSSSDSKSSSSGSSGSESGSSTTSGKTSTATPSAAAGAA